MKEATFFILCSKFLNFQIFKFLDNRSTLTELNRFIRFKKFCDICELTLYQSNVNLSTSVKLSTKNFNESLNIFLKQ